SRNPVKAIPKLSFIRIRNNGISKSVASAQNTAIIWPGAICGIKSLGIFADITKKVKSLVADVSSSCMISVLLIRRLTLHITVVVERQILVLVCGIVGRFSCKC